MFYGRGTGSTPERMPMPICGTHERGESQNNHTKGCGCRCMQHEHGFPRRTMVMPIDCPRTGATKTAAKHIMHES